VSDDLAALTERLHTARTDAMRRRDRAATSALRTALSAIANAEAVDASVAPRHDSTSIAGAVTGVGAAEVARRELTFTQVVAIVHAEIDDLRASADEYDGLGQDEQAAELRAGADAVERALDP
jgi:uncharacterized protein YqeY